MTQHRKESLPKHSKPSNPHIQNSKKIIQNTEKESNNRECVTYDAEMNINHIFLI